MNRWLGRAGFAVVALALFVRLAAFFGLGYAHAPLDDDEGKYLGMARALWQSHTFAMHPGGHPTSWSGPAFSALLVPAAALGGTRALLACRLWNILIGACLPLAAFGLARRLFGNGVGLAAGIVVALYPMIVYWNMYLLTETVYALGLTAVAWVMVWSAERDGLRRGAVLGVAVGLVSLIRPIGLLLAPLLGVWWLIVRRDPPVKRLAGLAAIYAALVLTLVPWTVRNYRVHGKFVPVNTNGGINLVQGNNPVVWNDPVLRGRYLFYKNPRLQTFFPEAFQAGLKEDEIDAAGNRRAHAFILAHPARFFVEGSYKLKSLFRVALIEGDARVNLALWATYGLLFPFMVLGFFHALLFRRASWPLHAVVLAVMAGCFVYYGSPRLRLPVEPILIVFGIHGIGTALAAFRRSARVQPITEEHSRA